MACKVISMDYSDKYKVATIRGQMDTHGPELVGPIFEVKFLVDPTISLYSSAFEVIAFTYLNKAMRDFRSSKPHTTEHSILEIAMVSSDEYVWKIHSREVEK